MVFHMSSQTSKLPTNLFSFITFFLKKQWKWVLVIQAFALAWSFDHTLWPYILMKVIDSINLLGNDRSEMWSYLAPSIVMAITLWIVLEISFRTSGFVSAKVIPKLEAD